ncbi:hypothetical protein Clacol_005567 [Clathrus columnatus]|uniref:Cytochrome c oxidase assembly factor 5 n=1 Tax=Clathrus columnatus TaxID=1419009 RepID=A0AAV5AHC4_9AGAM|nr:hypothetical protein Clacol_005567 [Clathrus columnatus]
MNELSQECQALRRAVFNCKRSQLDMRKRFRGKPVVGQVSFEPDSKTTSLNRANTVRVTEQTKSTLPPKNDPV